MFNLEDSESFVGRELGVSEWITVDQERIDRFAACTGDDQWLHVDVNGRAAKAPTAGPVPPGISACRSLLQPRSMSSSGGQVSGRHSTTASSACASSRL